MMDAEAEGARSECECGERGREVRQVCVEDRVKWTRVIGFGHPWREPPEVREEETGSDGRLKDEEDVE